MISLSNILKQSGYYRLDKAFRVKTHLHLKGRGQKDEPERDDRAENDHEQYILDAQSRAAEILSDAEAKAKEMQAAAKKSIEAWWQEQREQDEQLKQKIRKQFSEEGYEQGYADGMAEAQKEAEEQLIQTRKIVDAAYIAKEQIISEAEPFLVRLSLDVAEKVIGRQIELDNTVIVDMVQRALERCHEMGLITILVKPEYFPLVQEARDELKQLVNEEMELKVLPDRTLASDGCVIRSQRGSIDARVDVQLNEIRQVLLEVAKEGEASVDAVLDEVPAASL